MIVSPSPSVIFSARKYVLKFLCILVQYLTNSAGFPPVSSQSEPRCGESFYRTGDLLGNDEEWRWHVSLSLLGCLSSHGRRASAVGCEASNLPLRPSLPSVLEGVYLEASWSFCLVCQEYRPRPYFCSSLIMCIQTQRNL